MDVLRDLPPDCRVGVGVVDQKQDRVESLEDVVARARRAVDIFGAERVLLTPDCGFATFADNPVAAPPIAEAKLRTIVAAAEILRRG
jgi:5-methyltetrahydropteroyltriglutamate--homocysteine methyltransferase